MYGLTHKLNKRDRKQYSKAITTKTKYKQIQFGIALLLFPLFLLGDLLVLTCWNQLHSLDI